MTEFFNFFFFLISDPLIIEAFTQNMASTSGSSNRSLLFSPTDSTQTERNLTNDTPRKNKLKFQVKTLKRKIIFQKKQSQKYKCEKNQLQCFKKYCDKFLNKPLAEIIKLQALLKGKTSKGRRYSEEYKNFALTLYF